jgi:hypothetical protein
MVAQLLIFHCKIDSINVKTRLSGLQTHSMPMPYCCHAYTVDKKLKIVRYGGLQVQNVHIKLEKTPQTGLYKLREYTYTATCLIMMTSQD